MSPVRAFMFPPAPWQNLYLQGLTSGLTRHGCEVADSFSFDEAWLERNRGDRRVLHLHMPSHAYRGTSRAAMEEALERYESFLARAIALGYGVVWTAHNLLPHDSELEELERRGRLVTVRYATRVIAHCELAATKVDAAFGPLPHSPRVVPHGSYAELHAPPPSREEARARLGIDPGSLVLLALGNLRPYKGLDALLDAFGAWNEPNAHLVIAGRAWDISVAKTLRRRTRNDDRVRLLLGDVAHEQVPVLHGACDAVVLPYQEIFTSGAAVMALSMQRPVIAPRLGCMEEIAGKGAVLYDATASGALLATLAALPPAKELASLGQRGYLDVARHDWSTVGHATLNVYEECFRSPGEGDQCVS